MKKQKLINTLYNLAHSIIIILIMFDIVEMIGRDTFPKYELPFFFGIGGLFVGLGLGAIWEFGIEQNLLRMPSDKGDLINMAVCGVIGGILAIYIQPSFTFLLVSSIISIIFVICYFVRMWKSRLTRNKIDY